MAQNIWNHDDIPAFLERFADGDKNLHRLLVIALRKPILNRKQSSEPLKQLPQDAPQWLAHAFNSGQTLYTFRPHRNNHMYGMVRHIADWLKAAIARGEDWTREDHPRRLMHFTTVENAYDAADRASKLLRNELIRTMTAEEGTEAVMEFPDGWKIRQLITDGAKDYDGHHLRHCAGDGAYDQNRIYSLRDPEGKPVLTMEIYRGRDRDYLSQCKGYRNSLPEERTLPYITAFMQELDLKPLGEPNESGFVVHEGQCHSIFNLPQGLDIQSLDLSTVKNTVRLPEHSHIRALTLRATNLRADSRPEDILHNAIIPESCTFKFLNFEQFGKDGEWHNEEGPAKLRFIDGVLLEEEWYRKGKLDRADGPAGITYSKDGKVQYDGVGWYHKGYHLDHYSKIPSKLRQAFLAWDETFQTEDPDFWRRDPWQHKMVARFLNFS